MNLLEEYRDKMKNKKDKADNTIKNTLCDLKHFYTYFKLDKDCSREDILNLKEDDFEQYVIHLKEKYKSTSANRHKSSLVGFLGFVGHPQALFVQQELKITLHTAEKGCPTDRQADKFLEDILATGSPIQKTMAMIIRRTGVRISELGSLRLSNIDYINRRIKIEHTKNKKDRLLSVGDDVLEMIQWYIDEHRLTPYLGDNSGSDYLFISRKGGKFDQISKQLDNYFKKHGFTNHPIRHTVTNHLYKASKHNIKLVAQFMGNSPETLNRSYIHVDTEEYDGIRDLW